MVRPVAITPLTYFRIAFGALMFFSTLRIIGNGWVHEFYIDPEFLFPYYGFEWIGRPDPWAVYALFLGCLVGSLGVLLGAFHRLSALLFYLCFTYIELLDKTYYLNHYYFISLVALAMIFLPAHRAYSLDVRAMRGSANGQVQRWMTLLPKLMIGGLYFMAGLAKLNHAWLFEAMPMRMWLPQHNSLPVIGALLDEVWVAYVFSWAGALFDLSIPFLLFNSRTRPIAFALVLIFHGLTAIFFPIGVFPYMMMLCSVVFFSPDMLEKIITLGGRITFMSDADRTSVHQPGRWVRRMYPPLLIVIMGALFIFPWRFLVYPQGLFWHEQGYRFSWRVMLMEKAGHCFFYVKDPDQPGELEINNSDYLTAAQEKQMSTQPDMILQFAHHLCSLFQQQGINAPQVRVGSWVTLNGSGSRLFIDPWVDLCEIKEGWGNKDWVLPQDSVVTFDQLERMKDLRAGR